LVETLPRYPDGAKQDDDEKKLNWHR
jgi:hypothetical protein